MQLPKELLGECLSLAVAGGDVSQVVKNYYPLLFVCRKWERCAREYLGEKLFRTSLTFRIWNKIQRKHMDGLGLRGAGYYQNCFAPRIKSMMLGIKFSTPANHVQSEEDFGMNVLPSIRTKSDDDSLSAINEDNNDEILAHFKGKSAFNTSILILREWFKFDRLLLEDKECEKQGVDLMRLGTTDLAMPVIVTGQDKSGKTSILHYILHNSPCSRDAKILESNYNFPIEMHLSTEKPAQTSVSLLEIPQAHVKRFGFPFLGKRNQPRQYPAAIIYVVDAAADWFISEEKAKYMLETKTEPLYRAAENSDANVQRVASCLYNDFHNTIGKANYLIMCAIVLVNKIDKIPKAKRAEYLQELELYLRIKKLPVCTWYCHADVHIIPTCAFTGQGIDTALKTLADGIPKLLPIVARHTSDFF